jgi:hypothetical protein
MTKKLVTDTMKLTRLELLAGDSCPAFFGRSLLPNTSANPLYVCLDGNFQHQHHKAASKNYKPLVTPHGFLDPTEIVEMKKEIRQNEIAYNVQVGVSQFPHIHMEIIFTDLYPPEGQVRRRP